MIRLHKNNDSFFMAYILSMLILNNNKLPNIITIHPTKLIGRIISSGNRYGITITDRHNNMLITANEILNTLFMALYLF